MAKYASAPPPLTALPQLPNASRYVGIALGKAKHVAGFLSQTLLERPDRFAACPALVFANSRAGLRLLIERIRTYSPLEHVSVLLERTGH